MFKFFTYSIVVYFRFLIEKKSKKNVQINMDEVEPTQFPTTPSPKVEINNQKNQTITDHFFAFLDICVSEFELYWSQAGTQDKLLTIQLVALFIISLATIIIWKRTKPKLIEFQGFQQIERNTAANKKQS